MVFCLQSDALYSNVTTYWGHGPELQTEFSFTEVICLKIYATLSWNERECLLKVQMINCSYQLCCFSPQDFDSWFDTKNCLGDQKLVERLHAVSN